MDMMVCVARKAMDKQDQNLIRVTVCNECCMYNRGECCWTGMPMHPDDYCSKAVKAE